MEHTAEFEHYTKKFKTGTKKDGGKVLVTQLIKKQYAFEHVENVCFNISEKTKQNLTAIFFFTFVKLE